MPAINYDIVIEQGSKFSLTFVYKTASGSIVDLSGYTAAMQIRETVASASAILDISTDDDITITGAAGQIDIEISATDTAALDFVNAVYDLEITPSSGSADTIRFAEGKVKLSKQVTR